MATAEFSKFAGMLSATLSQHHLSGFETAQQVGFPGDSEVKASAWNVGDPASIPELGRSPGGRSLVGYRSPGREEFDTTEQQLTTVQYKIKIV